MKKLLVLVVVAVSGCVTSGNQCSKSVCSSNGPNNGQPVTECADATVGIGGVNESGSITYGTGSSKVTCSWNTTNYATQEQACIQAEETWCTGSTGDML